MQTAEDEVRAAMALIPGRGPVGTVERLGGLTNRVYRVEAGGETVVLRIPGEGTEAYIDRAVEAANARAAAAAGVSPEVLHVDPGRGLMLTRLVEGRTMTPALFREPGAPARAAAAFARLHRSGVRFEFRFDLFAMIEEYLRVLAPMRVTLPEGYHAAVAEAEAVRAALDARPAALAPCHCDPLCENFLDTGERMWIVDWEYSGMNDPLWDLGDLAVEGEFGAAQEEEMLAAYFGRAPTAAERGRVVAYKAMCDLLWTLWGLIQHGNGNPADDFWAYATNRFERCRRLMASEGFAGHLAAVRTG
ncbi:choline/ethanolamine kinase family protein [Amaricoccus sp.]|uniref:choline/ethanolamine kinase family protein n=1 Tax=Amaricoccus sp. TaxID=1872485 RepID=UPI002637E953|nr:choline/ethanolamine kinase family protein [Amaricoccus sp.]HRO10851.1 choline/ethanolamine kinase family protein [Amaricoccus sp.]